MQRERGIVWGGEQYTHTCMCVFEYKEEEYVYGNVKTMCAYGFSRGGEGGGGLKGATIA